MRVVLIKRVNLKETIAMSNTFTSLNKISYKTMLNIIWAGLIDRVTLLFGGISLTIGWITSEYFLTVGVPALLFIIACVKHYFDIQLNYEKLKHLRIETEMAVLELNKAKQATSEELAELADRIVQEKVAAYFKAEQEDKE